MPLIATIATRPSRAAAGAASAQAGRPVQPSTAAGPNCQLPEQVLGYLPTRQIAGPIASGTRGAVAGTSLSGSIGRSGEVHKIRRKQEVRQMYEGTPYLPIFVQPARSRTDVPMKDDAAQFVSVAIGCPTGRLAGLGSGVAA
ncbi:hypothetical protein A5731_07010 [Mycolicibacterium conceptionense]|uniref:Uncharacterized protein n=1 Tax=Mycolicibacterium conceptionense TaxID=451644 RepID=A0A1A1WL03_9MYCO|nr:hypothetical protein A5718_05615 [Mycolicibacterium conceptionense]OBF07494.1 hypothetical protein A5731_07010 [Mycolicibacterium conceptionense]OBF29536.1 hypothetical protein A5726_30520 [Mycolicibacterium conceptionense]OBF45589.1 hypothetical protein A5720_08530 [Mycolicibacterium conceptionense]OBH92145.1 hypothetical protein A5716_29740 [Mycolicibacterium conceptionense]